MAQNALLEEFALLHAGQLQRRLTDLFDSQLSEPDLEVVANVLRAILEEVIQERITEIQQGVPNVQNS